MEHVTVDRRVAKRLPCPRHVVPSNAAGRVEAGAVADGELVERAAVTHEGGLEIHQRVARVGAVADVPLVSVVHATEIRVGHVPQRASEVFLPILNAVVVSVARIFSPGWVRFTVVKQAVAVDVLFPVIKRVAVGVVVAGVACLSRIAVRTVDLDAIGHAVSVRVGRGGVGQEGEGFVRIVEAVTVRVGHLRVGGRDPVHLCSVGGAATGPLACGRVARRGGFRHRAVRPVAEAGRRAAHGGPGWVDVFEEVVQTVTVRIAVGPVGVGGRGGIQAVGSLPTVRHAVTVGVPASRVLVDVAVTVVVVGQTIGVPVAVGIRSVNEPVFVVIKSVGADVAYRVFVAQND